MTAGEIAEKTRAGSVVRPRADGQKLYHLQALRGLAASLVVVLHSVEALTQRRVLSDGATAWLGSTGYFGVATFFVISGFILCKTSPAVAGSARGARLFLIRRAIRVFPLYWIATAVFIALSPHRAVFGGADIVSSFLLIPHVIALNGNMHPLVGQGWSLQYELLFYIIFATGLVLGGRRGRVMVIATLLILAAAGAWIKRVSDLSEPMTILEYWTRPIMLLFAVGIGIAMAEERIRRRLRVPCPFLAMVGLIALWFVFTLASGTPAPDQQRLPVLLLLWLLCALCVFVSIFGRPGRGLFEPVAEAFGDASYSVYLFHTFVLSALLRLNVQSFGPTPFIVAALFGANVMGVLVYRLVERPVLRICRRVLLRSG